MIINKHEQFFNWLEGFTSCWNEAPPDAEAWALIHERLKRKMAEVSADPRVPVPTPVTLPSGPVPRTTDPLAPPYYIGDLPPTIGDWGRPWNDQTSIRLYSGGVAQ